MSTRMGQFFISDATHTGRVLAVNPIDPTTRILTVAVQMNDMTTMYPNVPVVFDPGRARNLRVGMQVAIVYPYGSTQMPVAIGRLITPMTFPIGSGVGNYVDGYVDALPSQHEYPDDDVFVHPETGAWERFRNTWSTAKTAAPDGSPCQYDLGFASGVHLTVLESLSTGMPDPLFGPEPPPPDQATITLDLPAGAGSLVVDVTKSGGTTTATASLTLVTAGGTFSLVVDSSGDLTVTAPGVTTIVSPKIELGSSDLTSPNALIRRVDLEANNAALQAAIGAWATTEVQHGSGAIGPTTIAGIDVAASTVSFTE